MPKYTYRSVITPMRGILRILKALGTSQTHTPQSLTTHHTVNLLKARHNGLWVLQSIDEEELNRPYARLTERIRNALEGNQVAAFDRERLKTAVLESPGIGRKKFLGR